MNLNILGYIFSTLYMGSILLCSFLVYKKTKLSEISRKIVHIGLGIWPLIAFKYFDNIYTLISIPVVFMFINLFTSLNSHKIEVLKFIETREKTSWVNLGTFWYAFTLTLLMVVGYYNGHYITYISFFALAFGDGFAALVGQSIKSPKMKLPYKTNKSLSGCSTVFLVSMAITISFYPMDNILNLIIIGVVIGSVSMFSELFSDNGTDNLYVPLNTALSVLLFKSFTTGLVIGIIVFTMVLLLYSYYKKALTINAVSIALLVAQMLLYFGGLSSYIGLISFFILCSAIGKFSNRNKQEAEKLQKGSHQRNIIQVLMNSLPGLILGIFSVIFVNYSLIFKMLSFASFAVSTSDTFASEIGMNSKGNTWSILTFKKIQPGLSGGVSLMGIMASIIGSILMGLIGLCFFSWQMVIIIIVLGIVGSIIDSILGDLVQVKFETENGILTEVNQLNEMVYNKVKGISFIDNNMVNILSNILAMIVGYWYLFSLYF